MVRTRIAPSPTGYPHIGTIYQALFNYAFAKKNNGRFIIRIEDTDRQRFVVDAEEKLYEAIDWFGLSEDESPRKKGDYGPYRQSERLSIYKKYAEELVKKGDAYYCYCSKERLEEVRKKMQIQGRLPMYDKHCLKPKTQNPKPKTRKQYVIRLRVPENKQIIVNDGIRGRIAFDSNLVDDQVLLKSDGFPTYHLAVVVDDHLMKITHVVRGEEWLSSSPKHQLLYEYLSWQPPLYFHTPIIRNPDRSKLSKRHGHTNVSWYQQQGFLPEAILNFLALLGWTHPEEKELFSLDDFIRLFEPKDLKPIGPIFNLTKLEWLNGEYIRRSQISNLKSQIYNFYNKKYPEEIIRKTVPLIKERIKKLSDYLPLAEFFFQAPKGYELDLSGKKSFFEKVYQRLQRIKQWKAEIIGQSMQDLAKNLEIKNSQFFMDLRVAVKEKKITPPLNESMEILGKEECLQRIKKLCG